MRETLVIIPEASNRHMHLSLCFSLFDLTYALTSLKGMFLKYILGLIAIAVLLSCVDYLNEHGAWYVLII